MGLRQELGALIRATYNEYNGQHNLQSPLMENDVLLRMQEAEMDDSNADANQNDDLMDINDTTDQELGDLISNDVNYQARYGEVEYLVDLEDGVASFAPIEQLNNEDQFQFSQI